MIILHIAPISMNSSNGLRFSVPGLTSSQNIVSGVQSGLMTIESSIVLKSDEVAKFDFDFMTYNQNINLLEEPYNNPDIVVFHGVYFKKYLSIYKKLIARGIPYIIVPRVSLTYGAQKQNYIKKKLGNFFLFNGFISNANGIQYLTENEKATSKKFKTNSFVVGNGIKLPTIANKSKNETLNISFIGRYDVNHKGLDVLVKAIILIKNDLIKEKVKFRLYGSDRREGKKYLMNAVEKYDLHEVLEINNPIYEKDKESVLKETDVFIAPSRFEGHPMAVIEAMAYGIPCILTKGTNMMDKLIQYDAGWATELSEKDIARTVLIANSNRNTFFNKGLNARRLVEENYTWDKIAKLTIGYYDRIINNE
jgi:glycosyltransferase involved in cell wall biosynthesis